MLKIGFDPGERIIEISSVYSCVPLKVFSSAAWVCVSKRVYLTWCVGGVPLLEAYSRAAWVCVSKRVYLTWCVGGVPLLEVYSRAAWVYLNVCI